MKIILSRKGYDSASGGIPSPILPEGSICSLPIPSEQRPRLKDVSFRETNLGCIVAQLRNDSTVRSSGVHLDPDLNPESRPRRPGWRPIFGQDGAAQSHLQRHSVGSGDLFLFFGWFRKTNRENKTLQFSTQQEDIHCIFGWLQVDRVFHPGIDTRPVPQWASEHPHVKDANFYNTFSSNNTLYVAADRLRLPGIRQKIPGGGVFERFTNCLQLTEPGCMRSIWRLPDSFFPTKGTTPLSYHSDKSRWSKDREGVLLQTVGRGQEFVIDTDNYPRVLGWVRGIFKEAPTRRCS